MSRDQPNGCVSKKSGALLLSAPDSSTSHKSETGAYFVNSESQLLGAKLAAGVISVHTFGGRMVFQRFSTVLGILAVISVIGVIAAHSFGQSAADYLNQGHNCYTSGKLTEAIAAYERAVQLQPDDAYSHYCLAVAYNSKNMLEKAAELYEKAIELDEDFAEA